MDTITQGHHTGHHNGRAAIEETHSLIASDKVEGTSVYNRAGEHT